MDDRIFHPLQLSTGSHRAGSGKGCAMNVISWENGDQMITDYPACSDPVISNVVQGLNDFLGVMRGTRSDDGMGYILNAEDSQLVLDIAHQTVGTSDHHLSADDLRRVYTQLSFEALQKYPKHIRKLRTRLKAKKFMKRVEYFIRTGVPQRFNREDIPWTETHLNLAGMVDQGLEIPTLYLYIPKASRPGSQAASILSEIRSMDADVRTEQAAWIVARFKELAHVTSPVTEPEKVEAAVEQMLVCTV